MLVDRSHASYLENTHHERHVQRAVDVRFQGRSTQRSLLYQVYIFKSVFAIPSSYSDLTMTTKHAEDRFGSELRYDNSGELIDEKVQPNVHRVR